ncbi:octopamine receptor beta-2R-like [Montipora capricornis]|uniref:octopamine receptor beta-2R-like n=1 Tax=Montipora capricornis TaxID=246305 RepID=UPI0035F213E3
MADQDLQPSKPLSEAIPLGVLGALITLENLLVCFLVYRFRNLQTFNNGFVVSLAVSDILFGGLLIPVNITDQKNPVNEYLIYFILVENVTSLLAVTFDRFLAVMYSLSYTYFMTKHFFKILMAAWIVPVPFCLLPLAWSSGSVAHEVYTFFIVIGVILPYIFIIFAYIKIYREVERQVKNLAKLRKYENSSESSRKEKRIATEARVAKVFAIIAGIFLISWMPVFYMTIAGALKKEEFIPMELSLVSWYTMTFGSLANALVYAFFKADFRNAFLHLFRCKTKAYGHQSSSNEAVTRSSVIVRAWGPFLQSPENFSGPKSNL